MSKTRRTGLPFMKMHGAGNDFVVIDTRAGGVRVDAELARAMGDRHRGIGFDQLAVISEDNGLQLTFYNSDGSTSAACGNATRCIAAHEMELRDLSTLTLTTERGALQAVREDGAIWVNMGMPLTRWDEIPLAEDVDTDALPMSGSPVATSMGNPHCTFLVDETDTMPIETLGPDIETHPLFPARTNVQTAWNLAPDRLRMRVWERGVGMTLASGSSACAVASAAHRRGLTGTDVTIEADGGILRTRLTDEGIWLTGPTAHVFDGVWRG